MLIGAILGVTIACNADTPCDDPAGLPTLAAAVP